MTQIQATLTVLNAGKLGISTLAEVEISEGGDQANRIPQQQLLAQLEIIVNRFD